MNKIKGLILTAICSLIILFLSVAFAGYDSTLVKKRDLVRDYPNRDEVDKNFCKTGDTDVIKNDIGHILKTQDRILILIEKLENNIHIFMISQGSDEVSQNTYPDPCPPICKKKKKRGVV